MSQENEFAHYAPTELSAMSKKLKIRQNIIKFVGLSAGVIIGVLALIKGNTQLYPVSGLLLVMATVYPLISLGPIRKKIQEELDSRSA